MIGELSNHLWQSTIVALAAALLALAFRRNQARVRYWIWFSASVKFLVPFSLLIALGSQLEWTAAPLQSRTAPVSTVIVELSVPFSNDVDAAAGPVAASLGTFDWRFPLLTVWISGFLAMVAIRWRSWRQIRAALRGSVPVEIPNIDTPAGLRVRAAPGLIEPGIVGLWRPILLFPAGIEAYLTAAQLEAVVAHELCHVRRRDNLTAAIHMVVEVVFWFHPLVWWIGTRLVEERERACDEEVLRLNGDSQAYAEGILNVCKRYVEPPLACVPGVGGANLRKRIEAIMSEDTGLGLSRPRRLGLAAAATAAILAPVLVGAMSAAPRGAAQGRGFPAPEGLAGLVESPTTGPDAPRFEVASIRPNKDGTRGGGARTLPTGRVTTTNITLRRLIGMAYGLRMTDIVVGGPEWIHTEGFDVDARPEGEVAVQRARLMLRTLLAERFKLAVRRESREMPVYALRLANADGRFGAQLQRPVGECVMAIPAFAQAAGPGDAARPDPAAFGSQPPLGKPGRRCGIAIEGPGTIKAGSTAIIGLITLLTPSLDRPVIDKTGLGGVFDFDLRYMGAAPRLDAGLRGRGAPLSTTDAAPDPSDAPNVFTAVREQLGLRLDADRGPVDVLVVDGAERPTAN
jgi:uncharacterized protein (TIGR03435 family)